MQTSTNEKLRAQFFRYLTIRDASATVEKRGPARGYNQRIEPGQRRDKVLDYSVDKVSVLTTRQIVERENGNRWFLLMHTACASCIGMECPIQATIRRSTSNFRIALSLAAFNSQKTFSGRIALGLDPVTARK